MLPTTSEYYCVLVVVFFAFWLLRGSGRASVGLVLLVNLFFYARWGWIYLALVPAAATSDFFIARAIGESKRKLTRRLFVSLSVGINIGLIVFCRYAPATGWLLPLTLSFYAFQALTYTLDIYRGDARPVASYLTYLSSVTFFPTIAAGPITRVAVLAPQWNWKGKTLSAEDGGRALFLIALGLIKKFLIADYLGNNLVNRVFDLPTLYTGGDVLVGVYAYAFQLYYDFSGYSDIAIGSALLLGIRLPANFNAPYRATNIADFWKRWHITFSNWLRDYLYFSLPGKRTRWMPYLGLVITMVAGGLWHGASATFAIWGLLHGAGLAVFRLWQSFRKGLKPSANPLLRLCAGLLTFHFVLLAWIFFRAASVAAALQILSQIASLHFSLVNATPQFLLVLALAAAAHFVPKNWYDLSLLSFNRTPAVLQAAVLAMLLLAIRTVSTSGAAPFIYSKF
jgi:D-alanyl-lipoteichoic acid acyltransferase DltB (MBOAT superfamily)